MQTLLEPLERLAEYQEIVKALPKEGILSVTGCLESQKVHLMAGLSGLRKKRLIIAQDERAAREIYTDILFFEPEALLYPARDLLFFQADVHGNLLTRQRMQVFQALLTRKEITVVTTVDGCMDYLPSLLEVKKACLSLKRGDLADLTEVRAHLAATGYEMAAQVTMPGQYSVRGGILDVYALTEEYPWRIEFFDDEIDDIRSFECGSQRSIEPLTFVTIYPAAEQAREKSRVTLTDYFDREESIIFLSEPNRLSETAQAVYEEFDESRRRRLGEEAVSMDWLCSFSELAKKLNACCCVSFSALKPMRDKWKFRDFFDLTVQSAPSFHGSIDMLVADLKDRREKKFSCVLLTGSRTRAERLAGQLREEGLNAVFTRDRNRLVQPGEVVVMAGMVRRGFIYPLIAFGVFTESDIMGFSQKKERKKRKNYNGQSIQDFTELHPGDYVVHERHGLGIYKGIEKVEVDHISKDYIRIEYQDGAGLLILATQLDQLQKYSAADSDSKPKLNHLGGPEWRKTKGKVQKAVKDIARDLVELYAARQKKQGFVYGPDTVWQKEFEETFPFEETEDQLQAIEDTKRDMESGKIMDRLICGDVGYGKTEIALRAAFKTVQEDRQVVYLVPTTILVQQHYNTFSQRMKDFPVRVELLSRFRTAKQCDQVVSDLKKGLVDIVIGTHRVLSKDVSFKNLGLLIIDEEQRFGVTHKERIKKLKKDVDVLTLTATPIPRTLHMSLIGIRDMSVLEEPPRDRMPIQTYVMEYDPETVREAISREMRRGGQVYYVYNRVHDIQDRVGEIRRLVPEARVGYVHGQMSQREMEDVMVSFIDGDLDVLVSTTIIETGLDISNVNTMIIHDSDRYGLSQLYQLRGRIGRSNRTAYAFLMYRTGRVLKETAEKRLSAIRQYTDLGSGFKIAMKDLEIRGAGNLLGGEQSGHMNAVGYDLYCKMLSTAVREEKGEVMLSGFETTIYMDLDAFLPDAYVGNEYQKLDLYKRIAAIESREDFEAMLEELLDRFGDPPKPAQNLLEVALLKALAHKAYISEVHQRGKMMQFVFTEEAKIDPSGLPALMALHRNRLTLDAKARKGVSLFLSIQNDVMKESYALCRELEKLTVSPEKEKAMEEGKGERQGSDLPAQKSSQKSMREMRKGQLLKEAGQGSSRAGAVKRPPRRPGPRNGRRTG